MSEPTLRLLSLGAGVQSTTLALMACRGILDDVDGAIFADTGWEPKAVYAQVDRLAVEFERAGIPFYRVSKGNLRADTLDPAARFVSVPWFIRNPDGGDGMGRRQCTSEYKLAPINRKVRELLGAKAPAFRHVPRGRVAEQWIGFSTDEWHRIANRRLNLYTTQRYPLFELGMSRKDCERWLRAAGWGHTAKSACIGCPFHGNAQWRALRDTCECGHHRSAHYGDEWECGATVHTGPAVNGLDFGQGCECSRFRAPEWADAVDFDRRIRKGGNRVGAGQLDGEAFLHRSRVPLDLAPIDRVTPREWADRQTDIFDELAEHGDPDGCSPYGCRSGEPLDFGEAST